MNSIVSLPLASVYANPNQPRHNFDERALQELSASIKEYGVMSPILVTPRPTAL